jgi:hypothetical protein
MADRIRITITTVVEYECDPSNYEASATIEDMARVDLAAAEDDPFLFETMDGASTDTKAEVLKGRPRTLVDAGYAPGNYMGACTKCAQTFVADKLALVCEPCATSIVSANPFVYETFPVSLHAE